MYSNIFVNNNHNAGMRSLDLMQKLCRIKILLFDFIFFSNAVYIF